MKKQAIAKYIARSDVGFDLISLKKFAKGINKEFEDNEYLIQCDDLNNGPAEKHNGEVVVDVWESFPGAYTRFTLTTGGKVNVQERG